ncbi:MAG: peptide/nickel transport system substrate-binding protein, partial [Hyphomicrobiaceae bacterium]
MSDIKSLETLVKQGAISRRDFVKRAAALGVAAGLPLSMMSGVAHAAPKKGGKLRVGLGHGSTTDSLDPGTHENGFSSMLVHSYNGYLTEVDPGGNLIPEIAAGYEATPDAKVWRFKIRQGVEFHNGKTLTPKDVVASLNFHRGEDSKSAGKGLLTAIEELKIEGDTVVFTLKDGNADFPYIMSDYHFPMLPEKDGKLDWASGIGAGAYSIVNYEPGVRAQFKRHDNYWKEGRAHFDEVEMLSLLDITARQNAGMNGDVDVIDKVDP